MEIKVELKFPEFCYGCPCNAEACNGCFCSMGYWSDEENSNNRAVWKKPKGFEFSEPMRPKMCIKNHGG